MQAAFAIAEFYDVREDRDHEVVVFLLLVKLFGDDIFKVALPGIQKHRVRDAAAHDRRVKRAADIVKRAQVVSALYVGGGVVGRDHDDGERIVQVISVYIRQNLKPVHFGHHDIQKQKRKISAALCKKINCRRAVIGFDDIVLILQNIHQKRPVHFGIVCNQDFLLFHWEPISFTNEFLFFSIKEQFRA